MFTDLCNQEVHIFRDKDINLLLEDGLDIILTLAAEVRRGLRDSSCHQSITLIGHLPGQVTSCLVYLLPLKQNNNTQSHPKFRSREHKVPCFMQAVGFMPTLRSSCHLQSMSQDEASEQLQSHTLTVKR